MFSLLCTQKQRLYQKSEKKVKPVYYINTKTVKSLFQPIKSAQKSINNFYKSFLLSMVQNWAFLIHAANFLITDYGLDDHYSAELKAALYKNCEQVRILDVCHTLKVYIFFLPPTT